VNGRPFYGSRLTAGGETRNRVEGKGKKLDQPFRKRESELGQTIRICEEGDREVRATWGKCRVETRRRSAGMPWVRLAVPQVTGKNATREWKEKEL